MTECQLDKKFIQLIKKHLVALGPNKIGPNLLLIKQIAEKDSLLAKLASHLEEEKIADILSPEDNNNQQYQQLDNESQSQSSKFTKQITLSNALVKDYYESNLNLEEIIKGIISGFDYAIISGPLCEEPMMGVCFIVEDFGFVKKNSDDLLISNVKKDKQKQQQQQQQSPSKQGKFSELLDDMKQFLELIIDDIIETHQSKQIIPQDQEQQQPTNDIIKIDPYGPISGQIISAMKDCCIESFLGANPRLVQGMYLCLLQTDQQWYSKSYQILNKRRAIIIQEELSENCNIYTIQAYLPLNESFGFYKEMLKVTSGMVTTQLTFDTWKVLDIDPFYTPITEEEIEEHGSEVLVANYAKLLIDKIRKRKGIVTSEKIVIAAEKQRNLSKKK